MNRVINHGEWIDQKPKIHKKCSVCGEWGFGHYDHCPWCGSRNRNHGEQVEAIPCIIEMVDPIRFTLVLEIEKTPDRPNNPDLDEIVDTYIEYHYGEGCEYYYQEGESDYIGEVWNIENYR